MLEQDIIQPSTSPWSNPVVLVRKPDGTDRFSADFRKVNSVTKKNSYPLPRIAETFDLLNGTQFMSSIDLGIGYCRSLWRLLRRRRQSLYLMMGSTS